MSKIILIGPEEILALLKHDGVGAEVLNDPLTLIPARVGELPSETLSRYGVNDEHKGSKLFIIERIGTVK